MGFMVLLAANHFVKYSKEVADELEQHCRDLERNLVAADSAELSLLAEPAMLAANQVAEIPAMEIQEKSH